MWTALAYIDPGSGSMLLQIVVASLAAAVFFARRVKDRVAGALSRLLSRH